MTASLATFHNSVRLAGGAPCDVIFVGDSITEGQGSTVDSTLSNRWIQQVVNSLRATWQPTSSPGGRGYIPAYYDLNTGDGYEAAAGFAQSGTVTENIVQGLGRRAIQLGSGGTLTITVFGTSIDVVHRRDTTNSGTFSVAVDGGTATNVSCAPAPFAGGGFRQRISLGTRGAHEVVIAYVSGTLPTVEGVMVYDGDENVGVRLWDAAKSGYSANSLAANLTWFQSLQATTLDLAVIALGTNDIRTNRTKAQFKANVQTIITNIRSATFLISGTPVVNSTCPVVLVKYGYPPGTWSGMTDAEWAEAHAELASENANVITVDASANWVSNLDDDDLHPAPAGHTAIAEVVAPALTAGIEIEPTRPVSTITAAYDFRRASPYVNLGTGGSALDLTANGSPTHTVGTGVATNGSNQWLADADNDLWEIGSGESMTVFVRASCPSLALGALASKRNTASLTAGSAAGWTFFTLSTGEVRLYCSDGTSTSFATSGRGLVAGVPFVAAFRVTSSQIQCFLNGTPGAVASRVVGSMTNAEEFRVGRLSGAGTSYLAATFGAVHVVRAALTDDEIVSQTAALLSPTPVGGGVRTMTVTAPRRQAALTVTSRELSVTVPTRTLEFT